MPGTPSLLRPMTAADVPGVLAVEEPGAVLALGEVFPQDTHPFPPDEVAKRWLQELADPAIDCFTVVDDATVAGFAAVRGDEFLHFGIAVEQWGTGLADRVHDEVLELLRGRGTRRARLRVLTGNPRARRFYERNGWEPTGEISHSDFAPYPELLGYALTL